MFREREFPPLELEHPEGSAIPAHIGEPSLHREASRGSVAAPTPSAACHAEVSFSAAMDSDHPRLLAQDTTSVTPEPFLRAMMQHGRYAELGPWTLS